MQQSQNSEDALALPPEAYDPNGIRVDDLKKYYSDKWEKAARAEVVAEPVVIKGLAAHVGMTAEELGRRWSEEEIYRREGLVRALQAQMASGEITKDEFERHTTELAIELKPDIDGREEKVAPLKPPPLRDDGRKDFGIREGTRASNMAATKEHYRNAESSVVEETTAALQPLFDSLHLGKKCPVVARALCQMTHRTSASGALEGLREWLRQDDAQSRLQDVGIRMKLNQINALEKAANEAVARLATPAPTKCAVRVRCRDVELKLTLSPKLLEKPLSDGLVAPFLKAFCTRTKADVSVDDVVRVEIDGVVVDWTLPAKQLLRDAITGRALRAEAAATLLLRADEAAAAAASATDAAKKAAAEEEEARASLLARDGSGAMRKAAPPPAAPRLKSFDDYEEVD